MIIYNLGKVQKHFWVLPRLLLPSGRVDLLTPRSFCPLGLGSWEHGASKLWFEVTGPASTSYRRRPVSGGSDFTPAPLLSTWCSWTNQLFPPTFLTLYTEEVGPSRTLPALTQIPNCLVYELIPSWHGWGLLAICPGKQSVTLDRKPLLREPLNRGTA